MYNYPYLKDTNFLQKFDKSRNKEQIIKVTILDWENESPIQQITGSVISGNISLDGSSAMRRTANLSLLLDENNYNIKDINNIISINKKIQIMVGFLNNTDKYSNYPILWFPQGIFLIISNSISHDKSGIKVSLTLHDKMALLNGECGGVLPSAIVFNEIQNEDEYGNITITYPTIVQIIQELINHFGKEQLGKIIIKDLEPIVKQVLKWNGDSDTPLLVYRDQKKTKIQTLYYNIYKSIFQDIYPRKNFNKLFGSTKISNLQELILSLQQLQLTIKENSEILEKEEQNLKKMKTLLQERNFSLVSNVQGKIEDFYKDLDFIQSTIQQELQDLVTPKNSNEDNEFSFFKNNFTRKQLSAFNKNEKVSGYTDITDKPCAIFDVIQISKFYPLITEMQHNLSILKNCTDSINLQDKIGEKSKITEGEVLLYYLFNLNIENKQDFIKEDNYQNKQFSKNYIYHFPSVDKGGYHHYHQGEKINYSNSPPTVKVFDCSLEITYQDKYDSIIYVKTKEKDFIKLIRYNSKQYEGSKIYKNLKKEKLTNLCFFKDFVTLFKYFKDTQAYNKVLKSTLQDFEREIIRIIFSAYGISEYESSFNPYGTYEFSRLTVAISYLIQFVQKTMIQVQILLALKDRTLNSANEIKQKLLDFSLLKNHQKLKNGTTSSTNIQTTTKSFNEFVNQQMEKLENLINKLPVKKKQRNTSLSILYRKTAKEKYSELKQKINEMKKKIRDLNFSSQHQLVKGIVVNDNLVVIAEPFTLCFQPALDYLNEMLQNKNSIFNRNNYGNTVSEKDTYQIISNALSKVDKNIAKIQEYKTNFTTKTFIQLQEWLNSTTFNQKNNFNLPKALKTFSLETINLINNSGNTKIDETNNTITIQLLQNFLPNQIKNIQKISSNNHLIENILQTLPNYIESTITDDNLDLSLSLQEQISLYSQKLKEIIKEQDNAFYNTVKNFSNKENYKDFFNSIKQIKKFQTGEDVGYTLVDFIYPGSLTATAGETITSVLDKIKNTLGNYEYFYDINGNFIFQQIRNYLNKSYSSYVLQENSSPTYDYNNVNGKIAYSFNDGEIIQSYSNSINYQDIKNDFIIWGERKTADGQKYPIRYHLAIDNKPALTSFYYLPVDKNNIKSYSTVLDFPIEGSSGVYYYAQKENEFYKWIPAASSKEYENSSFFGYKKTTIKIKRCEQLPKDHLEKDTYYYDKNDGTIKYFSNYNTLETKNYPCSSSKDYRTQLYLEGEEAEDLGLNTNDYYTELKAEWPKLFNFQQGAYYPVIKRNPSNIDYYLDLLGSSDISIQYNISLIGKRTKIITNNNINCIFEPDCPDLIFSFSKNDIPRMITLKQSTTDQKKQIENLTKQYQKLKKYFLQWNQRNLLSQFSEIIEVKYDIYKNLVNGGTARSAYEQIRSTLYQYLSYNQKVSLTTMPIYYLQPNNLIQINDKLSNIGGNYLINNLSLPLGDKDAMTISCTKAITRI